MLEYVPMSRECLSYGKLMVSPKPANSYFFEDGNVINEELVGELHFVIFEEEHDKWRNLSPYTRARKILSLSVEGLTSLAEQCATNDPVVDNITVFHGVSHLVRPNLLEGIGFKVKKPTLGEESFLNEAVECLQEEMYGFDEQKKMRVGTLYEFWATRQQMVNGLPKLRNLSNRLQR